MLSRFSHVWLWPPGSSVCGSLQARILEWDAMSSSRGSSPPRDRTCVSYVSCTGTQVLYHWSSLGSSKTPRFKHLALMNWPFLLGMCASKMTEINQLHSRVLSYICRWHHFIPKDLEYWVQKGLSRVMETFSILMVVVAVTWLHVCQNSSNCTSQ